MYRITSYAILLISCSICQADNWIVVPSNDAYWLKTINSEKHELLIAYNNTTPHFLLIISTDSPPPEQSIPIWLKIDRGQKHESQLHFLKQNTEQSIFRIEINNNIKNDYIARMIAGLKWSIFFDREAAENRAISFSLIGFTVAFNNLLIANDIGSLDPVRLKADNKNDELFCYITSNITVQALQHRLNSNSYIETLHSISKNDHSSMAQHLPGIITQVYNIPDDQLPSEPGAEKYIIFKRCMKSQQKKQAGHTLNHSRQ